MNKNTKSIRLEHVANIIIMAVIGIAFILVGGISGVVFGTGIVDGMVPVIMGIGFLSAMLMYLANMSKEMQQPCPHCAQT